VALEVWTARYHVVDPDRLDITRGGADKAAAAGQFRPAGEFLAPSADLLWSAKRRISEDANLLAQGRISKAQFQERSADHARRYAERYTQEMRLSWRVRRGEWDVLLAKERAVLVCFCADSARCHRSLAAELLGKCGAVLRGEVPTLRAISVRQPWAWAILNGKDVENRGPSWAQTVPGEALLHAAKGCTVDEYEAAAASIEEIAGLEVPPLSALPRGGLIGRLRVDGVVRRSASPWFAGPLGLVLTDVTPCAFAPCAGQLGMFPVSIPWLERLGGWFGGGAS
jgi:hypothetical protein